jgi:serine/threonine protein kinase
LAALLRPHLAEGSEKYKLITKLLRIDPQYRITAKEALESPYFKEQPLPTKKLVERDPGREPDVLIQTRPLKASSRTASIRIRSANCRMTRRATPAPSSARTSCETDFD